MVSCSEGRLGSHVELHLDSLGHAEFVHGGLDLRAVLEDISPHVVHVLESRCLSVVHTEGSVVVEDLEVSRHGRVPGNVGPSALSHLSFHAHPDLYDLDSPLIDNTRGVLGVEEVGARFAEGTVEVFHELVVPMARRGSDILEETASHSEHA